MLASLTSACEAEVLCQALGRPWILLALSRKITKMITSMEVADAAEAAVAAAAEMVAEVEWWRAEVAVTEVVRRTR